MEFRIKAFVGPISVLGAWRSQIPSTIVVALTPDLGLVPVTSEFHQDLLGLLGAGYERGNEAIKQWGTQASKGFALAYLSADCIADFYSDGIQYAYAWINQQPAEGDLFINDALRLVGVMTAPGQREMQAVDLFRYEDTESWAAASILGEALSRARRAVPVFIGKLKHWAGESVGISVRREAAKALGEQGPAAKEAIPALAESARTDPDLYVRQDAIRSLGMIGRDAIPVLIDLMKTHADPLSRADAAKALGDIGRDARKAIPALRAALRDRDEIVRLLAGRALEKIQAA